MDSPKTALQELRIDRDAAPKTRIPASVFWVLLILTAIGIGIYTWINRPRPIQVQVVAVREVSSAPEAGSKTLLNASGYVTARRAATVSSKVTGKVIEILVEEGMKADEGQVLARLDPSNVTATLRLAEAQLEISRHAVEELKPNLAFAAQELKRFNDLVATKAASQSDLNRAEAESKTLAIRLQRLTAEVTVAERQKAQAEQDLEDTVIRAPFSGIVTSKDSQPGEMISPVSAGGGFTRTGICTIVDMNSLEIEVDVNESYINRVQSNQPVEAMLDAYPDWRIPCKVIAIIPTADRQKATVKVRIGFAKLDPRILPEMGVKVAFQSGGDTDVKVASGSRIIIPRAALQDDQGKQIVWVANAGKAERRAVTIAGQRDDEVTVAAGLRNGEQVITQADIPLTNGVAVKVSPP